MDKNLKRLRAELRAERCPVSVKKRLREEIQSHPRPGGMFALRWGLAALATLTAIFTLTIVFQSPDQKLTESTPVPVMTETEAAKEQAQLALAYFGKAFDRASSQSRDIILDASLPSLRQGLRRAGKIITVNEQN